MKYALIPAALLAWASCGSAIADSNGVAASNSSTGATGAEIYGRICQGCHMPQAQGAAGAGKYPSLAGDPALASSEFVAVTVLLGRRAMPAFGKPAEAGFVFGEVHISDAEIAEVVNYVRSHFGNQYKDRIAAAKIESLPHPIN